MILAWSFKDDMIKKKLDNIFDDNMVIPLPYFSIEEG
jgi:hypothetical protein|tara:strand:- start:97 stop:207 length:111 start_codon:yes stop_codon:yes gene_type:complete